MTNFTYVFLFFATIILSRGLTIIFHELGHALAGMFLYEGDFSVYIGSYGDPSKGLQFKIGRLKINFIYNPFSWDRGLCVSEGQNTISYKRQLVYIAGGPLGSLLIALIFFSLLFTSLDQILKVYAFLAFFYAFADFLNNLIPKQKPIVLFNGHVTYNDGFQIKKLLKEKNDYGVFQKLASLYNQKKYSEIINFYQQLKKEPDVDVLRLLGHTYLLTKENNLCIETFNKVRAKEALNADDLCNYGLAHWNIRQIEEAFKHYDGAIELIPEHYYTLNNRGYAYTETEQYEKALKDLEKVVKINSEFSYAWNNMGYAKIKLGLLDEGLADIEKSMQLDSSNSYVYRNKGVYYLEIKNYKEAYRFFEKAKELDATTYKIDHYLEVTKSENKEK